MHFKHIGIIKSSIKGHHDEILIIVNQNYANELVTKSIDQIIPETLKIHKKKYLAKL